MPDAKVIPAEKRKVGRAENIVTDLQSIVLRSREKTLLNGLNLCIQDSGITCLMGPNGAGKSLTLRILSQLLQPDEGIVRTSGIDTNAISLVFQKPVLLRRTVKGNLLHALKLLKVPRADRLPRLQKMLELADLNGLADTPARRLSGGEQQRLAMVRATASNPNLLLLDEPTASLDPGATLLIERMIKDAASGGTKIVLVTHDIGQAKRLADDVAFLHQGTVTEHTDAAQFFEAPKSAQAKIYLDGELLI